MSRSILCLVMISLCFGCSSVRETKGAVDAKGDLATLDLPAENHVSLRKLDGKRFRFKQPEMLQLSSGRHEIELEYRYRWSDSHGSTDERMRQCLTLDVDPAQQYRVHVAYAHGRPGIVEGLWVVDASTGVTASMPCDNVAPPGKDVIKEKVFVNDPYLEKGMYNACQGLLLIATRNGQEVVHLDVPESVARALAHSEAPGDYYRQHIRFEFQKRNVLRKDGEAFLALRSQLVQGVGYDGEQAVLRILNTDGSVVRYAGVPQPVYAGLLKAPIPTSYIRGKVEAEFKPLQP